MNKKYLPAMAIFMIGLVVSLIVYSADVMALELTVINVTGQDGVEGYRQKYDFSTINVKARIEGDLNITPNQFKIFGSTMNECTRNLDASSNCAWESELKESPLGILRYVILMYADLEGAPITSAVAEIKIDEIPPQFDSFNARITEGKLIAEYSVSDQACLTCQPTDCSGINKIEFYVDGRQVDTLEINGEPDECSYSGSTEITYSGEGTRAVSARVYDNMLTYSSSQEVSLDMDFRGPIIEGPVTIYNQDGTNLTALGPLPRQNLTITVRIREPNLNPGSVRADFSSLISDLLPPGDPALEQYRDYRPSTCFRESPEVSVCVFQGVVAAITFSGERNLGFYAEDIYGNSNEQTLPYFLVYDTTRPFIRFFQSQAVRDEVSYIREDNNSIILTIEEEDSGFHSKKISIDLSLLLGADYEAVRATTCEQQGSLWICTWWPFDVEPMQLGTVRRVSLFPFSTDDADNFLEGTDFAQVVYDNRTPSFASINHTTKSGECPTSGDIIYFELEVDERVSGVKDIRINTSGITVVESIRVGGCNESDNGWTCSVEVDDIISEKEEDAEVTFYVEDVVGHKNQTTYTLDICEADINTVPNVLTVVPKEIIPSTGIDRKVASIRQFKLFNVMEVRPVPDVKIKNMEISDNCVGTPTADDIYLLNERTLNPYIAMLVGGTGTETFFLEDLFKINCTMSFKVQKGLTIYRIPEEESIIFRVPVYNSPVSYFGDNVRDAAEDARDQIEDIEDLLDDWESWNQVLGILCTTMELMEAINGIMQALKIVVLGVSTTILGISQVFYACIPAPVIGAICAAVHTALTTAATSLWNGFCWVSTLFHRITTAIWAPGIGFNFGTVMKFTCMIYECRLCDWQALLNTAFTIANAFTTDTSTLVAPGEGPGGYSFSDYMSDQNFAEATFGDPNVGYSQSLQNWNDYLGEGGGGFFRNQRNFGYQDTGFNTESPIAPTSTWIWDPYKSIHYAEACLCLPGMIYNWKKQRQIECRRLKCISNNAAAGVPIYGCERAYKEQDCLYVQSAQYLITGADILDFLANLLVAVWENMPSIIAGLVYACGCSDDFSLFGINIVARFCASLKCGVGIPGATCAAKGPQTTAICTDTVPGANQVSEVADMAQAVADALANPDTWFSRHLPSATLNIACGLIGVTIVINEMRDIIENGFDFDQYNEDLEGDDQCEGLDI